MDWNTILDDVISNVQPECVPLEFILSAQYTDRYGIEHHLQGSQLVLFMANPKQFQVREARVVLDIGRIRHVMEEHIIHFFTDLDHQLEGDED